MKQHFLLFSCCVFTLSLAAQKPVFDSLIRVDSREIYFEFAADTLNANADSILTALYALYTKRKADSIYITAHTDNVGSPAHNRELSQKRAKNVKTKLHSIGVPDSVMRIEEFGESQPVASNETDAGRQRNRRATIDIYKKIKLTLLTGKLLDAVSKQGIAGTVDISTAATQTSVTTDTSGQFKTAVPVSAIIKLKPAADGYAAAKDTMFKPSKPAQPYIELLLTPIPKVVNVPPVKAIPADVKTKMFKGQLKNPATGAPISGFVIVETSFGRTTLPTDGNGNFEIQVPEKEDILLEPLAEGFSLAPIEVKQASIGKEPVKIEPNPIKIGDAITLRNLLFYPDESELIEESKPELEHLLRYLQLNKKLVIEIAGHVDIGYFGRVSQEDDLYILSEQRAEMVYNYLINNGIEQNRLSHKGYGNWEPKYPEPATLEEHAANRRVEIRILNAGTAKN